MPEGFLRHFLACNKHDLSKFVPFYIGNAPYGWISKEHSIVLPQTFGFFIPFKDGIALSSELINFQTRSDALAQAVSWLSQRSGRKPRHEMYPILLDWGDTPLAQIDRIAVPWFGVRGFGVHVNGYVRKTDGIYLWVGERAEDRLCDPGKLDNLVGGGQPIGLTLDENLIKEAWEEAGIEAPLAKTARPVRQVRYLLEQQEGLRNDTLFIYDLELTPEFVPRNTDGEVSAFHLLPLEEVAEIVQSTERFKFNCNLVVIDFLIRKGHFLETGNYINEIKQIADSLTVNSSLP